MNSPKVAPLECVFFFGLAASLGGLHSCMEHLCVIYIPCMGMMTQLPIHACGHQRLLPMEDCLLFESRMLQGCPAFPSEDIGEWKGVVGVQGPVKGKDFFASVPLLTDLPCGACHAQAADNIHRMPMHVQYCIVALEPFMQGTCCFWLQWKSCQSSRGFSSSTATNWLNRGSNGLQDVHCCHAGVAYKRGLA